MRALRLIVLAAVLLFGCGDDETASPGTTAAPPTTTVASATAAAPVLAASTANPVVEYLQDALSELGYLQGSVDGVFGAQTEQALAAFQSASGLDPSGRLDAATAVALADASPISREYAVAALETQLTELGFYSGAIDGQYDDEVLRAVEDLQREAGIAVDGVFGPATYNALETLYAERVRTPTLAAATATTASATTAATAATPTGRGFDSDDHAAIQRRLAELGYRPGEADGQYGAQTASAVMAFEKREGLNRDGVVGPDVIARLAAPQGAGPRSTAPGPRVEIDLDRQILFFLDGSGTVTTLNTSTGSGRTYTQADGSEAVAYTPTGSFTIERKLDGNHQAALGTMYRPSYFKDGWAIHGSPNIPAYPASHGCARLANWDVDFLYPLLPVGAPVEIYGTSLGAPDKGAPGF